MNSFQVLLLQRYHCQAAIVQTHQTRRHSGVSAAEAGEVAEVLTERETTHAMQTLCGRKHRDNRR